MGAPVSPGSGRPGHPVLFGAGYRGALSALATGAPRKAAEVFAAAEKTWIDWPSPGVVQDIDTPEDYRRLKPDA